MERIRRGFDHLDLERFRLHRLHREDETDEQEVSELPNASDVVITAPRGLRLGDVAMQSLGAVQGLITRYRMAAHPPDVQVTISSRACGTLDFHRAEELIDLGRREAAKALDDAGY